MKKNFVVLQETLVSSQHFAQKGYTIFGKGFASEQEAIAWLAAQDRAKVSDGKYFIGYFSKCISLNTEVVKKHTSVEVPADEVISPPSAPPSVDSPMDPEVLAREMIRRASGTGSTSPMIPSPIVMTSTLTDPGTNAGDDLGLPPVLPGEVPPPIGEEQEIGPAKPGDAVEEEEPEVTPTDLDLSPSVVAKAAPPAGPKKGFTPPQNW